MTGHRARKRLSARTAMLIVAYTKASERERHFFWSLADVFAEAPWPMTAREALRAAALDFPPLHPIAGDGRLELPGRLELDGLEL